MKKLSLLAQGGRRRLAASGLAEGQSLDSPHLSPLARGTLRTLRQGMSRMPETACGSPVGHRGVVETNEGSLSQETRRSYLKADSLVKEG